jgi:hypothetical protein
MTETPHAGLVLRYPYLWARQAENGETEGRKARPCAVILALSTQQGWTELRLCAVTSRPPRQSNHGVEVPEIEKRRAGLDGDIQLWVILDEHNVDLYEQSYHIEPHSELGSFSAAFTKKLQRRMIDVLRQRISRAVRRRD